jgi:hypothetical protein
VGRQPAVCLTLAPRLTRLFRPRSRAAVRLEGARASQGFGSALCGFAMVGLLACPPHVLAEIRLPPIDSGS